MSDAAVQRDLGRMEAEIQNLNATVQVLAADVREMKETMAEARGGWRTLLLIGGVIATLSSILGGVVAKFAPFLNR